MTKLETGLELIRRAEYFEAHEELEDAWRAAEPEDRDCAAIRRGRNAG